MSNDHLAGGRDGALLELLRDLIRTDSQNPSLVPGGRGEGEIAGLIAQYLADAGAEVALQEVVPGRPNVVGRLPGAGGGPSLMLCGHLDTVSVENMTIAPFEPALREGRVYGRGSYDMKAGVAAAVEALVRLARSGERLAGDVLFAGVADEEYASIGALRLVEEYTADACVLTEPTELELVTAHRGFAWARITTLGRAAHGSLYDVGVDAIAHAGRYLAAMEAYDRETLAARGHPLLKRPSIHASLIGGGLGISTYPDRCTFEVERRSLPGESEAAIRGELEAIAADLHAADPRFRAEVDLYLHRDGYEIAADHPVVRTLRRVATDVLGVEPRITGQMAWLDSAILGAAGIDTAIIGPVGEGAHAAVEWVDFASVSACCRILEAMARAYCGREGA